jgi:signal transduction histidine kinase
MIDSLERQARFELAARAACIGLWDWDLRSGSYEFSERCFELWRCDPGGVADPFATWKSLIHPEDRDRVLSAFQGHLREGTPFDVEYRLLTSSGPGCWLQMQGQAVRDEAGQPVRIAGSLLDVTRRREAEEALHLLNSVLEERVRDRTRAMAQIMCAREEEQRRIALDLHDGIGQSITSLRLGLRAVEDVATLEGAKAAARELRCIATLVMEDVRRLARGLRPGVLDDLGIVPALERMASECARTYRLEVSVDAPIDARTRLPNPVETALFRIAQEALNNVIKHARARSVRIALEREPGLVRMAVSDDGCGFDLRQPRGDTADEGFGLQGMKERTVQLNGSVTISSQPGLGTTVKVVIPLEEANHAADSSSDCR